ncbi:MAG: glycosyltransferase family 2 protein [Moheibacter sp.]
MPQLSIITINYNNKGGLEKTLNSVFNQSCQDFEYIVIDGASTDGSRKLIEKNSDKIDYWVSEPDKGIYNAMNKGIHASNGEYLLFLNSGDWLYEDETILKALPLLKNEDIIYGLSQICTAASLGALINPNPKLTLYGMGYKRNSLPHQSTFFKRSLMVEYGGYDERYKIVSDWAFYMIAIFKNNCSYKKIDNIISYFNAEGLSYTSEGFKLIAVERKLVMEENFKMLYNDFLMYDEMKNYLEKYSSRKFLLKSLVKSFFR